eukprot:1160765-Pelagomonas_calceolata.AAC.11
MFSKQRIYRRMGSFDKAYMCTYPKLSMFSPTALRYTLCSPISGSNYQSAKPYFMVGPANLGLASLQRGTPGEESLSESTQCQPRPLRLPSKVQPFVVLNKVRQPSQPPPEQRHIHLVELSYCEDTQPKNQLEAPKQQHHDLYNHLSRASAQVSLHTILLAIKLALKLHAHSVQYAYKLICTRRALEKTPFNSHHQEQARATARNLPDPH